jgi:2-succinyl-5-enolpyruvyl-6-hydroxy-3-cyclohexene-1-carboxylate synthase
MITGDPSKTLQACTRAVKDVSGQSMAESPWFLEWQPMDIRAQKALERWIAATGPMGELQALRAALEACPRGTRVILGNSLPVREADLVLPASDRGLRAFAIRGANGIDGVLATAVGAAHGGIGPTLVLIGDISFLHDVGSLHAARSVTSPLAIVVLDNRGGRIFEQLPICEFASAADLAYWTTPHEFNLEAAGAIYGIETLTPTDSGELRLGVCDALKRPSATLLVARVDPSSPRLGVESLRRAIEEAIF